LPKPTSPDRSDGAGRHSGTDPKPGGFASGLFFCPDAKKIEKNRWTFRIAVNQFKK
jgi:hypothetical protein